MSKKKSNNPLANQPFFIQDAYLDLNNEYECTDFLESVKEPAKQAFETYFPELRDLKQFEPRLFARTNWQKDIQDFLNAWYKGDIVAREKDKWLNEQFPRKEIVSDNLSEIGEETFMVGYVNLNLMGFLATEISEALNNGKKLRKCEALDCDRYFLPAPHGKEQRYCSMRCRKRAYMRKYRKK